MACNREKGEDVSFNAHDERGFVLLSTPYFLPIPTADNSDFEAGARSQNAAKVG
jgi:hypothetical protein